VVEETKWPDLRQEDLVNIAFTGRLINGLEHPKVQTALGKISPCSSDPMLPSAAHGRDSGLGANGYQANLPQTRNFR